MRAPSTGRRWRAALFLSVGLAAVVACRGSDPGPGHDQGASSPDEGHGHEPGHDPGHDPGHGHGHAAAGGLPGSTITHFARAGTDDTETELFVEFGPLIVGQDTPFAAHLTDCGELWTAVAEGRLEVELGGGGGPVERFVASAPSVPGIFRPVARPAAAGTRSLRITLTRGARAHVHDLGEIRVWASLKEAQKALGQEAEEGDDGSISFLKEQAWRLDFALAEVKEQVLSPTLRVFGELLPRSDGQARVSASASGRLVGASGGLPVVGDRVERGQLLAEVVPSVGGGGNLAAILLQQDKARIAVGVAEREVERVRGLVEQGAIPARRQQEAESSLARARAELAGAERLLAQHQGTVSGGRAPGGLRITAPITGVVTEVPVVAGSFVEEGETLFSVVDTSHLWLAARVPESQRGRAAVVSGGTFRTPDGQWHRLPESAVGHAPSPVLDVVDRTFPLRVPLENPDGALAAGTHVLVDLAVGEPEPRRVMPRSAVVYEQGVPVVYVMTEGESFVRRVVHARGEVGDLVLVQEGVEVGERVVSTGALYVKLASLGGGAAPAHGHVH